MSFHYKFVSYCPVEFGLEGFEVTGIRDREMIIYANLMKSVTLQRFLENILSSSTPIRVIATLKP